MKVDVYWSFRSPYSYLATPGMLQLRDEFKVDVNLRVVLPIAIRAPKILFNEANAPKVRYIKLDWARRARFLGMSDRWPDPDPLVRDLDTQKISSDQPYIYRLSYLGIEAQRKGRGIEFAHEVSHLLFGGTSDWDQGEHLAKAASRAGLNLEEMELALVEGSHLDEIESNQKSLEEAGHWGVPTFVYEGEPFFGQDRIDTLRWHLESCGLKR